MPSFCAVQNCDDKYGHAENISFHKFPFKRQELMHKWLEFAQRGPEWQPSKWSAICSRHFRDEDFTCSADRKTLRKTAVPCIQMATKPEQDLQSKIIQPQATEDSSAKRIVAEESETKSAEGKVSAVELQQDDCDGFEAAEDNPTCVGAQLHNSPSMPKIKCRLCGSVCSSVVSFSTNFEIYGMIQKCFPTLNIQKDDHLPKEMCRACLKRLESFSRFIDKVLETQSELQRKYRLEKANTNVRAIERQLKVKQEPVVRVKQEVAEGLESFISDDLDMAVDESCEQEPDAETNVEQKYDFCDFPMLNAQDIINNCDIMEIINLDDPFIDIPDDDANTNCENETTQTEQQRHEQQQTCKAALPSAHELLQAHFLNEEHNYAYAVAEDLKEEWQLKNTYKTEKPEGGEDVEDEAVEFNTNAENDEDEHLVYAGEQEQQTEEGDEQRADVYKETYPATALVANTNMDANKLPSASETSISATTETRSSRPIVTSVSELAEATVTIPNSSSAGEHNRGEKLMVTAVNNLSASTIGTTASSTESTTSSPPTATTMKPHAKPNIVVLNESIVKSSAVFQLHTCHYCHLKFFSNESLNQHYIVAHQMQPQQKLHADQEMQQQQHQQHQQMQLDASYNEQQQNIVAQNHPYQQQQEQLQQEQLPMVSVPTEYLWKPYGGMSSGNADEARYLNCKIEKGYRSPNTRTDAAYKVGQENLDYQQTNMFGQPFEFSNVNSTRDMLVTQNCSNPKVNTVMGAPNAVRILEMRRTFARQHEPYSNGIMNTTCEYDKMSSNDGESTLKSANFCTINVARMDESQMRSIAPTQQLPMPPHLIETKRSKQGMHVNKKIIARLKALERKLNSTAARNLIAAEYRQLRRLYTMLQLKCKRLELQIKEKHTTADKSIIGKNMRAKQQNQKPKLKTRFSCHVCGRARFKSIYHLLRHKRIRAHWTRPMRKHFAATCSGCEKFFPHKIALHNHMRYICQALPLCWFKTQMKTFKCRYCRRSTFNHWRLYRRHEVKCKAREQRIKLAAASKQRPLKIKQNVEKTKTRAHMKSVRDALKTSTVVVPRKLKTSTAAMREYACSICAKVYPSANNLNQHKITHTDERRHKCHLCERAFKRRNGLTQHVRGFHLQLKPHICTVCQRSYALKSDMLRCRHTVRVRIVNSLTTIKCESDTGVGNGNAALDRNEKHQLTQALKEEFIAAS